MQVCRLPAAAFVCNVHHLRALDLPQSPLPVDGHGLSSSEPHRKCQVASAPHQSNQTALSKGEKCSPGVVTAQRPTCPHLYNRLHAAATTLPLHKQGKSKTWRGTYVRPNVFDKWSKLDQPKWLRFLGADANDLWREDFLEPAPAMLSRRVVHKHSARKLRQVKCANIEESPTCFRRSEPIGMRASALLVPNRRVVEWQWRMPRGNLNSLCRCPTLPILYKEAHIPC